MKRKNRKRYVFILVILPLMTLLTGCDGKSKRELAMLKQFANDTPLFPGFQRVRSTENNGPGRATLLVCYNSAMSMDRLEDVKAFYSHSFAERGWSIFPEQDRTHTILYPDDLAFRKGDYMVGLKRAQNRSPGCNYLMTFVWEPWS
jgi:hypothetical protein